MLPITGEPPMPTPITTISKRILIMDDEILGASVLQDVLKHRGYAVELASGGEAGLMALRRERADLVLLDINMPGMNGLEVLKHVTEQHPDVPVVMVTAITDDTALSTAMRDGAYAWLAKPFDINELGQVVDAALNRRPYRTR
jgi:DNA-binding NtrC family response regulator